MRMYSKIILAALIVLLPLSALVKPVTAASLTDIVVTPDALTTSTAVDVEITFTPATAITNGSIIEVTYSTSFTDGADLEDTDIAITGTNIDDKTCSGFIAGYFTCELETTGSVTTTVTITVGDVNQLTTPSSAGNYSWSLTIDIGGAGTTFDTGAGLAYIAGENEVHISAVVPPVLALDLYQPSTTTLLSNPNSCLLGVLSVNAVNTCAYDVGVGTNNSAGATVKVTAGGAFTNGSVSMANASGAIVAGTESYGFYISAAGAVFTASGSYATPYQTVPTSETTFATSSDVSDKSDAGDHFTVTHGATMGTATATGTYTQTVYYTAYTK